MDYIFSLYLAPHEVEWRRTIAFDSDAAAVDDGRAMLAIQAELRPLLDLVIEIGRADGAGAYHRLGTWRWEAGAARWRPAYGGLVSS